MPVMIRFRILGVVAICVTFWLALPSVPVLAQSRKFFGRLVTNEGAGIPHGAITSVDDKTRFYGNNDGFFNFNGDPALMDTLVFSAPGYQAKSFVTDWLPDDSIIIELNKRKNILAEAQIGGSGNAIKTATSGIHSGHPNASCYLNIDDEIAVYLPADKSANGMVQEIGAYITREGVVRNDFKLHIYALDTATGGPGEEITDTVLVMHGTRGHEWLTADLSHLYIQMHGGVFVSMEWIVGGKNDYFPVDIPRGATNYFSGNDSLRTAFNGQVLGLDWQSEEPKVYRRYAVAKYTHKDEGKWYATPPLRGGHKPHRWIAPMIYLSYTYVDKDR